MKKLSVIIPTVLKKPKVLNKLLEIIDKDSTVDEILIVNNSGIKKSVWLKAKSDKIEVITKKTNMYVNPSWNYGIKKIKNENFLLLNDDLLVPYDFCKRIVNSKVFNKKTTGLIGMSGSFIKFFDRAEIDDLIIPKEEKGTNPDFISMESFLNTGDWGIAIFGKKENYYEIPDGLKIIYGDNYLLKKNLENKKINYGISNIYVNHIHSSSSASREFNSVVAMDCYNWMKLYPPPEKVEEKKIINKIFGNNKFQLECKGNVCIITHQHGALYIKFKDDDGIFSEEKFMGVLSKFDYVIDEKYGKKLYNEIKKQEKEIQKISG